MADMIYRKDAIKKIAEHLGIPAENWMKIAEEWMKDVPSAQPEIINCRECQHWKQGELVDKCGLLDCYADADCYCAWAVRERRQE